jgi:hypothetical protein
LDVVTEHLSDIKGSTKLLRISIVLMVKISPSRDLTTASSRAKTSGILGPNVK